MKFPEWFAVGIAAVWAVCLLVSLVTHDGKPVAAASVPMAAVTGWVFARYARNGKVNGSPR